MLFNLKPKEGSGVLNEDTNSLRVKFAVYLGRTVKGVLLVVTLFWLLFTLFSGSEEMGGGLAGIARNSPNAIPWVLLLVFVIIAIKREVLGGILVITSGVVSFILLDAADSPLILWMISLPLTVMGSLLIVSSYFSRDHR